MPIEGKEECHDENSRRSPHLVLRGNNGARAKLLA
jgi:hypothetical protein